MKKTIKTSKLTTAKHGKLVNIKRLGKMLELNRDKEEYMVNVFPPQFPNKYQISSLSFN